MCEVWGSSQPSSATAGLGCGHKFCRECALSAAGFGGAIGTLQNIASYIPLRTRCPSCRQPGVYGSAMPLKQVGLIIQSSFPAEWAQRAQEERIRRRCGPDPGSGDSDTGSVAHQQQRNRSGLLRGLMPIGQTAYDLILTRSLDVSTSSPIP
jgi:hypothetical protein